MVLWRKVPQVCAASFRRIRHITIFVMTNLIPTFRPKCRLPSFAFLQVWKPVLMWDSTFLILTFRLLCLKPRRIWHHLPWKHCFIPWTLPLSLIRLTTSPTSSLCFFFHVSSYYLQITDFLLLFLSILLIFRSTYWCLLRNRLLKQGLSIVTGLLGTGILCDSPEQISKIL